MRAIGTGGVWGKGWLQGPLTNGRDIPVMWADFPFAAIGEQFGLVGSSVVLGLIVIVLVRIWRIAHLSRDLLGTYFCAGVFTMLLWQTFQNVGDDGADHAGDRFAVAVHLLRRIGPDRVLRPVRAGADGPHASDALTAAAPANRAPSRRTGCDGVEFVAQWPSTRTTPQHRATPRTFRGRCARGAEPCRGLVTGDPAVVVLLVALFSGACNGSVNRRIRRTRSARPHCTAQTGRATQSAVAAARARRDRFAHGSRRLRAFDRTQYGHLVV